MKGEAIMVGLALITAAASGAGCESDRFDVPMTLGGQRVEARTLNLGAHTYTRFCATCHGHDGAAETAAARSLDPRPRAFTRARFVHKTTPADALPSDADLARSIRFGVPGTGMPPWPNLSDLEVGALVHYIKVFSPRWRIGHSQETPTDQTMLPAQGAAASVRLAQPPERSELAGVTALPSVTAHPSSDGGAPRSVTDKPPQLTAR